MADIFLGRVSKMFVLHTVTRGRSKLYSVRAHCAGEGEDHLGDMERIHILVFNLRNDAVSCPQC